MQLNHLRYEEPSWGALVDSIRESSTTCLAAVSMKLLRFKYFLVFATVVDVFVTAIGIFVLLQKVLLLLPLLWVVVVVIVAVDLTL